MQCLLGTFRWKNKVFKTYFSGDGNLTQSLVCSAKNSTN